MRFKRRYGLKILSSKIFLFILFFSFFFFSSPVFFDVTYSDEIQDLKQVNIYLEIGNTTIVVNDKNYTLDIAPFIVNNRTVVPIRFIAEAFNTQVEWVEDDIDNGEGNITISYQKESGVIIKIIIHTLIDVAYIVSEDNERTCLLYVHKLDVAPFIIRPQNRTLVPLRFISEALFANVNWDSTRKCVIISYLR